MRAILLALTSVLALVGTYVATSHAGDWRGRVVAHAVAGPLNTLSNDLVVPVATPAKGQQSLKSIVEWLDAAGGKETLEPDFSRAFGWDKGRSIPSKQQGFETDDRALRYMCDAFRRSGRTFVLLTHKVRGGEGTYWLWSEDGVFLHTLFYTGGKLRVISPTKEQAELGQELRDYFLRHADFWRLHAWIERSKEPAPFWDRYLAHAPGVAPGELAQALGPPINPDALAKMDWLMTKRGKEIESEFRAYTFPNAKNTLLISQFNYADESSISYLFDGSNKALSRVVKIEGGKVHSANTQEHNGSANKAIRFLAQHLVTRKD